MGATRPGRSSAARENDAARAACGNQAAVVVTFRYLLPSRAHGALLQGRRGCAEVRGRAHGALLQEVGVGPYRNPANRR